SELIQDLINNLTKKFAKNPLFKKFQIIDNTLFSSFDRCINLQFIFFDYSQDKQISLCVNSSILFPFYRLYILETKVDFQQRKWLSKPQRNKQLENNDYFEELNQLEKY